MAGKSSVVVRFLGDTTSLDRAAARASGALGAVESKSKSFSNSMNAVGTATVVAVGAIGVAAVKMGVDWQKQMTTLQTGAGESKANIDLVSHGLLAMAGEVGTSSTELANGMYMIESAGYHGAAGLNVLKAAAEGAKVGNADMATVANAVTSALNSYHLKASDAAKVTNTLIATVSNGKMKMDDLAGALGNVLPVASLAHISLAEVGGALSTMTMQGVDANTAATFLRQTISKLQAPTKAQADEMKSLGLSAIDVSQNMGQRGLAGTLTLMTDAITKKMGPSGIVMIEHLKKLAAHTTNFQKALIQLPPAQQTYVAALAAMMGGTKTLQGALLLSGTNMKTFAGNTKAIGAAAREGGSQIKGWTDVTADLQTQIDRVREGAKAWLTELGMQLIPLLQKVIDFVGQHSDAAMKLATVIAGVLALTVAWRIATLAFAGVTAVIKVATAGWTAAQWLLNAAMTANPIGLIIAGLLALAAAVYLAWNHSDTFRAVVLTTWSAIKTAVGAVVDWFMTHVWPTMSLVLGYIVGAWKTELAVVSTVIDIISIVVGKFVSWFADHVMPGIRLTIAGISIAFRAWWNVVSTVVGWIVAKVTPVAKVIGAAFGSIIGAVSTVLGTAASIVATAFGGIMSGIQTALSGIKGFINSYIIDPIDKVIGAINAIPGHTSIPSIPHLANGGIVSRPTLALIGEAGPEAVVPLSRGRGGMGGGDVYHITINGPTDPLGAAQAVRQALVDLKRRTGTDLGLA